MGHKVHPYGFRLGVSRTWTAKWYADNKEYTASLQEDIKIRQLIDKRLANASVSGVEIERGINHVTVTIHTAKPGIVIGKGGANVEVLRQQIGALSNRKVIERAKGLLMKLANIDENEAFKRLQELASEKNQKLIDAANSILAVEKALAPRR